jgi:creatinine amidohydrolase
MDVKALLAEWRDEIAAGAPVWLPVNPVEYHGPHLSLDNDALIADGLLRDVHARLAALHPGLPLLVLPDLRTGCGSVEGPGSVRVSPREVRRRVLAACDAIARAGARRVAIMTFHGAPHHDLAIQAGVDALARRGIAAISPINVLLHEMVHPDAGHAGPVLALVRDPAEREAVTRELRCELHAGFLESSLTMHYAPETVRPIIRDLPPCVGFPPFAPLAAVAAAARAAGASVLADELDHAATGIGWLHVRPFPGYSGRPHLASAEAGAVLSRLIVEGLAKVTEATLFRSAPPPRPPLEWAWPLTLGGRLAQ